MPSPDRPLDGIRVVGSLPGHRRPVLRDAPRPVRRGRDQGRAARRRLVAHARSALRRPDRLLGGGQSRQAIDRARSQAAGRSRRARAPGHRRRRLHRGLSPGRRRAPRHRLRGDRRALPARDLPLGLGLRPDRARARPPGHGPGAPGLHRDDAHQPRRRRAAAPGRHHRRRHGHRALLRAGRAGGALRPRRRRAGTPHRREPHDRRRRGCRACT